MKSGKIIDVKGKRRFGTEHLLDSFENSEMSKKMFVQGFTENKDYLLTSTTLAG